jgi:hypothetical protein
LPITQIISGGQTGVDRGALDAALSLKIAHGGWCPKGRLAEDGVIPSRYRLTETDSSQYHVRTEKNVCDADGTLIVYRGILQGGTELTRRLAVRHSKPLLMIDTLQPIGVDEIQRWLADRSIRVLNVAGPRESSVPGIAEETQRLLKQVLTATNA